MSSSPPRPGNQRQYETDDLSPDVARERSAPSLFGNPETFRELLRELIYGSASQKSIAIELFGSEKVGNSYSRLAHALQEKVTGEPSNNFDVDWVAVVAKELSPAAKMRLAWWFLAELGIEPGGPRSLVFKRKETVEERLAALEERMARAAKDQQDALRELGELHQERGGENGPKKNGGGRR